MSADYDPEEDIGFHFHPTDEELIKEYLIPKLRVRGDDCCGYVIATKDVYAMEPSLVVDHNDPFFIEDGVYYCFSLKKQISVKKIGCGKNSKRRITGDNDVIDRGFWRQNNKRNIIEEKTGNIIGTKENLTYHTSNKKKQKRGDSGASSIVPEYSWIMTEYMLPEYMLPDENKFQKLVLCKIHKSKKSKKMDDLHEFSASLEQQPININSESVVAASSEIPHVAYPCSAAETERNREQSAEANMMISQIDDWLSAWSKDSLKGVTMNGSGFPIEEGANTPLTGQNLLHDHEASTSTHHHESSSSEQQQKPINLCYKIQEKNKSSKKKDDDHHHKAHIPHHHDFSYYSEIFETHGHYPEIPRIQSMSNSAAETERNKKHNGEENMIHQIYDFSSMKLDDAYDKDEEWDAAIMPVNRNEADAPQFAMDGS